MNFWPEGWEKADEKKELREIERLIAHGDIVCGRATLYDAQKALHARYGGWPVEIPPEEAALGLSQGLVREVAVISRVGRPIHFVLTGIVQRRGRPVLTASRAAAQSLCRELYLDTLLPGDILPCVVTRLEGFGAFCDVGCGISALLPIDRMSVSRIHTPEDRLCTGQRLYTAVAARDAMGRLLLTMKELLGTWEENAAAYAPGCTVTGTVRTVETYGIFVELAPNLAGLAEAGADVRPGDGVSVYIKSMVPEKMKIKLVILSRLEDYTPPPLVFAHSAGHMDVWRYSPPECPRVVETVFAQRDGTGADACPDC